MTGAVTTRGSCDRFTSRSVSGPRFARAVSLGFGVLFATLITLVLVPTAYMILDDVGRAMRRVFRDYKPAPDVEVNRVWRVDAGPPCGDAYGDLIERSGS